MPDARIDRGFLPSPLPEGLRVITYRATLHVDVLAEQADALAARHASSSGRPTAHCPLKRKRSEQHHVTALALPNAVTAHRSLIYEARSAGHRD